MKAVVYRESRLLVIAIDKSEIATQFFNYLHWVFILLIFKTKKIINTFSKVEVENLTQSGVD